MGGTTDLLHTMPSLLIHTTILYDEFAVNFMFFLEVKPTHFLIFNTFLGFNTFVSPKALQKHKPFYLSFALRNCGMTVRTFLDRGFTAFKLHSKWNKAIRRLFSHFKWIIFIKITFWTVIH